MSFYGHLWCGFFGLCNLVNTPNCKVLEHELAQHVMIGTSVARTFYLDFRRIYIYIYIYINHTLFGFWKREILCNELEKYKY